MPNRLSIHLILYTSLVVAMLFLFPSNGSFSSDDGAYAGQVFALQQGDWALERPVTDVAEANEGWINNRVSSQGPLPYTRHPGYVFVLLASSTVFGDTYGLGVPAVFGSILCVLMAWLLAAEYDRQIAPLAFWTVGLGPLLVNSTTFWAHTLAAGLAGIGLWAAVRAVKKQNLKSAEFWALTSMIGVSSAAAILLRTEAVLWFAGLAVGFVLLNRTTPTVTMMSVALIPAAGAFIIDRSWGQSILDRYEVVDSSSLEEASWLSSRIPAGFHLLLSPSEGAGVLFVVLGLCLVTYGAVKFRFAPSNALASMLIAAGGTLFIVPVVMDPSPISGLLAAWPVLIAAVLTGSKRPDVDAQPPPSLLYVPVCLLTVAVLATQYAAGGGLEWGARYLSPAFVGLGVLAALNLRSLFEKAPLALSMVLLGPALLGVGVTYQYHERNAEFVAAAVIGDPDVVIANQPAGTRIAWSTLPTAWYTADDDDLNTLLLQITETEAARIAIFGFDDPDVDAPEGYEVVDVSDQVVQVVAK